MEQKNRCEGWRRRGGIFTFGPVEWSQCENESIAMLTVQQKGKKETLPACAICWEEVRNNEEIIILDIEPIIQQLREE